MSPEPFVKVDTPRKHAYRGDCDCSDCFAAFHRNIRSRAGNPHQYQYAERPLMSWVPILVGLGWTLAAALVIGVILVAAGVWHTP